MTHGPDYYPEPVARECICTDGPRQPGEHGANCEAAFRLKFFAVVKAVREHFKDAA